MNILRSAKSIFRGKGRYSFLRIISLGTALAAGLTLIGKIVFEVSYDNSFSDNDRIYIVETVWVSPSDTGDETFWNNPQVSGAIAPGIRDNVPGVESATRITYLTQSPFTTDKNQRLSGISRLADEYYFDILDTPILAGDPTDILKRPMYALVSRSVAEKIDGEVIGTKFIYENYPDREITIGGIFDDLPENTTLKHDILVSLVSIGNFMGDGSENWLGNDRYIGYVKLEPGIVPESLAPAMREMQFRHQNIQAVFDEGNDLWYELIPLNQLYKKYYQSGLYIWLLSIVALVLIGVALLNYVLILISETVGRSKEVAVYKCYGASAKDIFKVFLGESSIFILLSLIVAATLIFSFRSLIERLLGASLSALFSFQSILLTVAVIAVILVVTVWVPSRLFVKIPAATVFRSYKKTRRTWKLALLFVEVICAGFAATMLTAVTMQYKLMINDDPGYTYDRVLYIEPRGLELPQYEMLMGEIGNHPNVEVVTSVDTFPFQGNAGNNVYYDEEYLFNFGDMYDTDENILPLFDLKIIEGEIFVYGINSHNDVIVSSSFAKKVCEMTGLESVVGQQFGMSEHGYTTIVGVFDDIRIGSVRNDSPCLAVMFCGREWRTYIAFKVRELDPAQVADLQKLIDKLYPDSEYFIKYYSDEMVNMYSGTKNFRDLILIGAFIILLIVLIGLVSYLTNEVGRRRSEIAIRKISGGSTSRILSLLSSDILKISLPALIIGIVGGKYVCDLWLRQFSIKANTGILLISVICLILLIIILGITVLATLKHARTNPAEIIKKD